MNRSVSFALPSLFLLLAPTFAHADELSVLEGSCAMQIAGLVSTAHKSLGNLKNPVLSTATDAELIRLSESYQALTARAKPTGPDPALQAQLDQKFAAVAALAKKSATKPQALCVSYLQELTKQVFVVCPEYLKDQNDPAKSEACKQKASDTPSAKAAFNAWTSAGAKLVSKKR